jgi:hypothetical protein
MEVSGQLHAPAALLPGKEPLVSIRQEAGWALEAVLTRWWREKFPAHIGYFFNHSDNFIFLILQQPII